MSLDKCVNATPTPNTMEFKFMNMTEEEFDPKPLTYDNIFEEVMKRMAVKPMLKHSCNNCGGVLEMEADKHIFRCPYCGTVYAIGTEQLMAH